MIPVWLALLALGLVYVENAIRVNRRDRKAQMEIARFSHERDQEFQRLHELIEVARATDGADSREQAFRQMHAELSKVHRTVVAAEGDR